VGKGDRPNQARHARRCLKTRSRSTRKIAELDRLKADRLRQAPRPEGAGPVTVGMYIGAIKTCPDRMPPRSTAYL
jgi:hypothetical protein